MEEVYILQFNVWAMMTQIYRGQRMVNSIQLNSIFQLHTHLLTAARYLVGVGKPNDLLMANLHSTFLLPQYCSLAPYIHNLIPSVSPSVWSPSPFCNLYCGFTWEHVIMPTLYENCQDLYLLSVWRISS